MELYFYLMVWGYDPLSCSRNLLMLVVPGFSLRVYRTDWAIREEAHTYTVTAKCFSKFWSRTFMFNQQRLDGTGKFLRIERG